MKTLDKPSKLKTLKINNGTWELSSTTTSTLNMNGALALQYQQEESYNRELPDVKILFEIN